MHAIQLNVPAAPVISFPHMFPLVVNMFPLVVNILPSVVEMLSRAAMCPVDEIELAPLMV